MSRMTPFSSRTFVFVLWLLITWIFPACASLSHRLGREGPSEVREESQAPKMEGAGSEGEKSEKLRRMPDDTDQAYYVHTVKWYGETLSIIAKWYTGELTRWKAIALANPDLDPDRIFQGNRIRIPKGLMITNRPMPQEFLGQFMRRPTSEEIQPKTQPMEEVKEAEPELFGPKKAPRSSED
jgi:hypothetical protein